MNILIIEDDELLARNISTAFKKQVTIGKVKILESFSDLIEELNYISSYDIVITDLQLSREKSDFSGYDVIRTIREKGLTIPVIVMSAFSEIERLRTAFEYGANDYVIKPIRLKELELRIQNWIKNHTSLESQEDNALHYENLKYSFETNSFYLDSKKIPLTKYSKRLLQLFITEPETLLRNEFLSEKIWGDIYLETGRNIRINILRLKRALEPFGIDEWIRNVRGE